MPEVRAVTQRLLERYADHSAPAARVEAAERIVQDFAEHLRPLLGSDGFRMLLARALKRAQVEHELLRAVRAEREGEAPLVGLREAARARSAAEVEAALESTVVELLGLIARFLGPDMAVRLVRHCYPEIESDSAGRGSRGEEP
jgi:hypothetical protein